MEREKQEGAGAVRGGNGGRESKTGPAGSERGLGRDEEKTEEG